MRLVTFQTRKAFDILQREGILITDTTHIDLQKYGIPYDWMVSAMKKKKILPIHGESYPLWAWVKCGSSIAPKKKKNKNGVIQDKVKITFEKPDNEVLVSDYMAYSFLLSGHIVPKNQNEYAHFLKQMTEKGITLEDLKKFVRHQETKVNIPIDEIQKTWSRIFHLKSYVHQACLWNIRLEEVKKAEILDDSNYLYGALNTKRKDDSRPDWKQAYLKFLK